MISPTATNAFNCETEILWMMSLSLHGCVYVSIEVTRLLKLQGAICRLLLCVLGNPTPVKSQRSHSFPLVGYLCSDTCAKRTPPL